MKLLLDTCSFLWLTNKTHHLSSTAKDVLENSSHTFFISDVTVWEICMKWQAEKLPLPKPPPNWVTEQKKIWQFNTLPIKEVHLYRTTQLPDHHRDPFDRLLVAQCLVEQLAILTPDPQIHRYPIEAIW